MLLHTVLQCQSKLLPNVVETKNFAVTSVSSFLVTRLGKISGPSVVRGAKASCRFVANSEFLLQKQEFGISDASKSLVRLALRGTT